MEKKQTKPTGRRGGPRPGGGRPAGLKNKRTLEQIAAIEATGITPLQYLLSVMRDEEAEPAIRLDAARSAAPYAHAKIISIDAKIDQSITVEIIRL